MNNLIFMNSLKLKGHTEEFPSSSAESIPLGQPFTSRSMFSDIFATFM